MSVLPIDIFRAIVLNNVVLQFDDLNVAANPNSNTARMIPAIPGDGAAACDQLAHPIGVHPVVNPLAVLHTHLNDSHKRDTGGLRRSRGGRH